MTRFSRYAAAAIGLFLAFPAGAETFKDAFPDIIEWVDPSQQERLGALEIQSDTLTLVEGVAALALPQNYYALNTADARWVMETLWGNPADSQTLALIFQRGTSPLDGSWAAAVTSSQDGHISDIEAATLDFNAILSSYRQADAAQNVERAKAGQPSLNTQGWSGTPGYDKPSHSLRYGLLLQQGDDPALWLNAHASVLGRHGMIDMNVIATAEQAAEVDKALPTLVSMVQFAPGNGYEDFIPGVDTVRDGGLSALMGGAAPSAGLLVLALLFLKKGAFLVLFPLAWVWVRIKARLFGRPAALAAAPEADPGPTPDPSDSQS